MKTHGMLTLAALEQHVANGTIATLLVVFTDLYGRFMGPTKICAKCKVTFLSNLFHVTICVRIQL